MSNLKLSETRAEVSWTLEQNDFEEVAQIARQYFGLALNESKKSLIQARLTRRMEALGLSEFSQYLNRLNGSHGVAERQELLSVLTTNVTHFFREDHHFKTLREDILPGLMARARAGGRVRIWSAGCSTGQEPYSIAMTVLDMFPDAGSLDFKILATDIDPVVVEKAQSGSYTPAELEGLPAELSKAFVTTQAASSAQLLIKEDVKKMVTFKVLNLIEPLPVAGPFDAIFCRNVTIYFDRETQAHVWGELCAVLDDNAFLFIGHSERISGQLAGKMQKEGFTTYRKVP
jgi:chemotaxis protein methyltransferase CheR